LLVAALLAGALATAALAQEQYQDGFPPDTGIRKGPKQKTDKRKAKFEFGGSEPGVTFECRLDEGLIAGPWLPCTSPYRLRGLARRTKYVFFVRAVDVSGNADPNPADRRWKVTKKS
jgi:large repetitive protein